MEGMVSPSAVSAHDGGRGAIFPVQREIPAMAGRMLGPLSR
jgi:hypothetical protein